ncbi:MAG TPA: hypothetical protein VEJ63_16145, partial [Planctomycetota bacterium]|nr:hypothetical protein [Planctomycetota bacterium]
MKTYVQILAVLSMLAALTLYVTAESPHQSSTVLPVAPFELIQGTTNTNIMIRLNKYTGEAWYMIDSKKDQGASELSWLKVAPPAELIPIPKSEVPQFQVYISGSGISAAYLLHVTTGATFVLSGQAGPRVDPKLSWVAVG